MMMFVVEFTGVEIGTKGFMLSFFSTINKNLEDGKWGSKFPILMRDFCDNQKVEFNKLDKLKKEIEEIKVELSKLDSSYIVTDIGSSTEKIDLKKMGVDLNKNCDEAFGTFELKTPITTQLLLQIEKAKKRNCMIELIDF